MIGVCLEIKFYAFVAYDVATFCKDVNMWSESRNSTKQ